MNQIQSIDTNSTDAAVTEFRTLIENVERTINSTEEIRVLFVEKIISHKFIIAFFLTEHNSSSQKYN